MPAARILRACAIAAVALSVAPWSAAMAQTMQDFMRVMPQRLAPLTGPAQQEAPQGNTEIQAIRPPAPAPNSGFQTHADGLGMTTRNIRFRFGSAELDEEGQRTVRELARAMLSPEGRHARVLIIGHTDAVGSDEYNLDLSRRRAATVRRFLIEQQVEPSRVEAEGRGRRELARPEDPTSGENRRADLRFSAR